MQSMHHQFKKEIVGKLGKLGNGNQDNNTVMTQSATQRTMIVHFNRQLKS